MIENGFSGKLQAALRTHRRFAAAVYRTFICIYFVLTIGLNLPGLLIKLCIWHYRSLSVILWTKKSFKTSWCLFPRKLSLSVSLYRVLWNSAFTYNFFKRIFSWSVIFGYRFTEESRSGHLKFLQILMMLELFSQLSYLALTTFNSLCLSNCFCLTIMSLKKLLLLLEFLIFKIRKWRGNQLIQVNFLIIWIWIRMDIGVWLKSLKTWSVL